ncbi:hypothetical protein ACM26V_24630 [Salipaludibacillus sp. HK11]|uniref:hypothetical protein n=1 Tax=Salipaludibacillus sp. HK11 TaxID=3394320 RepID=UPI0039FDBC47
MTNEAYEIVTSFEVEPSEVKAFNVIFFINYKDEGFKERIININNQGHYVVMTRNLFFFFGLPLFLVKILSLMDNPAEVRELLEGEFKSTNLNFLEKNQLSFQKEKIAKKIQQSLIKELDHFLQKELKTYYGLKSHPKSVR